MQNVIELDKQRQNRDLKNDAPDRDIVEAIWYGIEHSIHSKDVDHPELPGSLGHFMKHVADLDPRFYLSLLAKLEPPND